jgi:hypothetical protein
LLWADGTPSGASMRVQNLAGVYGIASVSPCAIRDPLLANYAYALSGVTAKLRVTNLRAGAYDFYVYTLLPGSGDAGMNVDGSNAGSSVGVCGGTMTPVEYTNLAACALSSWQPSAQYVVHPAIMVNGGDAVCVDLSIGQGGYQVEYHGTNSLYPAVVVNGLQILKH